MNVFDKTLFVYTFPRFLHNVTFGRMTSCCSLKKTALAARLKWPPNRRAERYLLIDPSRVASRL